MALLKYILVIVTTTNWRYLLQSFGPRPLLFWFTLCLHNNTWNRNIGKKLQRGRPGSIHHVNDVRWTRDGHRGRRPKWRTGPSVWVLYRVFRLHTLALLKLLVLTSKKLAFKFSTYVFEYWSLPTYIHCASTDMWWMLPNLPTWSASGTVHRHIPSRKLYAH